MKASSVIELSESALSSNLKFLRRVAGSDRQFCSVVKGDAYGHRIDTYVPLAERCGVRHFAVFSSEEAADVLDARTQNSSIMIMGTIADEDIPWAIEHEMSFFVFDLRRLNDSLRAARKIGKPARIHLEVETGLFRTGLDAKSLAQAIRLVEENRHHLEVQGLCTHFSGAESSANYLRIEEQQRAYDGYVRMIEESTIQDVKQHIACSAAIFNYPSSRRDLVRIGIAQYGYWPSEETRMAYWKTLGKRPRGKLLKRVLRWKSRVMTLKTVPPGAFVGYGLSYQAMDRMRTAAVPVGYAHGIPRAQSNAGHVLIRGQRCPIVGTVNMNMMTVDVSHVPGVKPSDEVVLIGSQGDEEIAVGAFGERTHNLNYEVLVRISTDIPRRIVA